MEANDVAFVDEAEIQFLEVAGEERRRWRLILGRRAEELAPSLGPQGDWLSGRDRAIDRCLEMVYGALPRAGRGRGTPGGPGGRAPSNPYVPGWLDDLHGCFPKTAVEMVQSDAIRMQGWTQILM